MKSLKSVDGYPDLARDPNSHAILNINKTEVEAARERKRLREKLKQEEENMKDKVDNLEKEIGDIKNLLSQLVEKL